MSRCGVSLSRGSCAGLSPAIMDPWGLLLDVIVAAEAQVLIGGHTPGSTGLGDMDLVTLCPVGELDVRHHCDGVPCPCSGAVDDLSAFDGAAACLYCFDISGSTLSPLTSVNLKNFAPWRFAASWKANVVRNGSACPSL